MIYLMPGRVNMKSLPEVVSGADTVYTVEIRER